jgi:hypothetical protein
LAVVELEVLELVVHQIDKVGLVVVQVVIVHQDLDQAHYKEQHKV